MSYYTEVTLVYGIKLANKFAEQIYDNEADQDNGKLKNDGNPEKKHFPSMWANRADGRIHGLFFEEQEDLTHILGVAVEKDAEKVPMQIPQKAIDSFEFSIKPLMDKYGIKGQPELYIILQTI